MEKEIKNNLMFKWMLNIGDKKHLSKVEMGEGGKSGPMLLTPEVNSSSLCRCSASFLSNLAHTVLPNPLSSMQ